MNRMIRVKSGLKKQLLLVGLLNVLLIPAVFADPCGSDSDAHLCTAFQNNSSSNICTYLTSHANDANNTALGFTAFIPTNAMHYIPLAIQGTNTFAYVTFNVYSVASPLCPATEPGTDSKNFLGTGKADIVNYDEVNDSWTPQTFWTVSGRGKVAVAASAGYLFTFVNK